MRRYKALFESTLIEYCRKKFFEGCGEVKNKEVFDRCIKDVKGQGKSEDSAYAICKSAEAGGKK
jgi:hypothetical protein